MTHPWVRALGEWALAYVAIVLLATLLVGIAGFDAEELGNGCTAVPDEDSTGLRWRLALVGIAFGIWTGAGLSLLARSTRWLTDREQLRSLWDWALILCAVGWAIAAFTFVFVHSALVAFVVWLMALAGTAAVAVVVGMRSAVHVRRDAAGAAPVMGGPEKHWLAIGWIAVPVCTLGLAAFALLAGPLEPVQEVVSC